MLLLIISCTNLAILSVQQLYSRNGRTAEVKQLVEDKIIFIIFYSPDGRESITSSMRVAFQDASMGGSEHGRMDIDTPFTEFSTLGPSPVAMSDMGGDLYLSPLPPGDDLQSRLDSRIR